MKNAVLQLAGHAKKACAEEAGASSGPKYAAALIAQAETLRVVSTLLETAAIREMVLGAAKAKADG